MARSVPISRGKAVLVSECDYALVSAQRWVAKPKSSKAGGFYAYRSIAGKTVYLHRFILGAGPGMMVDHINGDGLDNRRENLRLADASLNNVNRGHYAPKSGYRGVYPACRRWVAAISVSGRNIRLGRFASAEDAARAYDVAAARHFGEFARLNFPAGRS